MTIEEIAKICHEANRMYCETLGDFSQLCWAASPGWQQTSAINGVRFLLKYPDSTPEAVHESWRAQKQSEGWVYGLVKDPEKKEHPCMLPYCNLPEYQKVKDKLFRGVVDALKGLAEHIK